MNEPEKTTGEKLFGSRGSSENQKKEKYVEKKKGESEPLRSRDDQAPRELATYVELVALFAACRPSPPYPAAGPLSSSSSSRSASRSGGGDREPGLRFRQPGRTAIHPRPLGTALDSRRASEGTALPSLPPIMETTFVVRLSAATTSAKLLDLEVRGGHH